MSDDVTTASEMADEVHAILRMAILAMDTNLIPEKVFRNWGSGISPCLEVAERKMREVCEFLEIQERRQEQ